jgi:hypothetical protein
MVHIFKYILYQHTKNDSVYVCFTKKITFVVQKWTHKNEFIELILENSLRPKTSRVLLVNFANKDMVFINCYFWTSELHISQAFW